MENVSCSKCVYFYDNKKITKCNSIDSLCLDYFRKYGIEAPNKGCPGYKHLLIGDYKLVTNDRVLGYVLAGKSEFKIVSGKTGREIYYRITRKQGVTYIDDIDKKPHYMYWIFAGDSEESKEYLGTIYLDRDRSEFKFSKGINGTVTNQSVYIKAIMYVLNRCIKGIYSFNVKVYHNGYCGKCGKKLSNVGDITSGIDKNCFTRLDIPKVRNNRPV